MKINRLKSAEKKTYKWQEEKKFLTANIFMTSFLFFSSPPFHRPRDHKKRRLWGREWLRVRNEFSSHAQKIGQEVAILGADQNERGLWGREW